MTILACSASDSNKFKKFLLSITNENKTIEFIINMLNSTGKQVYSKRIELIYPHFKTISMVGGIQHIDVTDTATGIANKLLKGIPSVTRHIKCSNKSCEKYESETILKSTVISVNVYNEEVDVQKEIESIMNMNEICESCKMIQSSTLTLGEYLIIEINTMPEG